MAQINDSAVFNYQNGLLDSIVGLNEASNGTIAVFLLLGIFLMMFFLLRGYDNKTVFISASTVTMFTSFLFWISGLVEFSTVVVVFCIWLISLFFNSGE